MSGREADQELLVSLGALADEVTMRSWRSGRLETRSKSDGSPVTAVDIEVERTLRDFVLRMHPDDGFVSEELEATVGTSGRCWYVDGVDGTTAYAEGRTEWSTLIALTDRSELRQGLCTAPALGKCWYVDTSGQAVRSDLRRDQPHPGLCGVPWVDGEGRLLATGESPRGSLIGACEQSPRRVDLWLVHAPVMGGRCTQRGDAGC